FEKKMNAHISGIYEDREGNVWVSTLGKGLIRFQDGTPTIYNDKNGLAGNFVNSFHQDSNYVSWIATTTGLTRLKNGTFTNYTQENGLFTDYLCQVLEDGRGNLWISSHDGILRVRKQDLNNYATGKITSVPSVAYGKDDGMRSIYCSGGNQSCGHKTPDGKMWFATNKGAVMIDPYSIRADPPPSPASIQQVLLDGAAADITRPIIFNTEVKHIRFHFSAVNLRNPDSLRFKYKLEGYQDQWIQAGDTGTQRTADFTTPDPGEYRFRVAASNGNGVWNENVAWIKFEVVPPWQTQWLNIAVPIILVIIVILLIYFSRRYMRLTIFWKNQIYVGNFKLLERIGIGGMGTVYKARTLTGPKREVAIKLLREELFENESVRERFKQEAVIIDQLDHPNIIKVFERGESRHNMFIAMELLEGKTLAKKIEQEGRLELNEALEIMIPVAHAVEEIHSKNIVHRDLKPGNIMLINKDENPNFVKLLDFGLAKPEYRTQLTQTGIIIGTIHYMAPEQFSGSGWFSATDIYAMGVMFREMLTGRQPFAGENSIEILKQIMDDPPIGPLKEQPGIPAELDHLIVSMIAKDLQSRPNIRQVLDLLQQLHPGGDHERIDRS
ncbi:MAG: protein kinase, partial [bacterium]|nr:protein kinase [bacterium]